MAGVFGARVSTIVDVPVPIVGVMCVIQSSPVDKLQEQVDGVEVTVMPALK